MVLEQLEVFVSLVLSIISFLAWIYTVGFKMGTMQTQLNTLWEVYVKDALSEARRGIKQGNPKPLEITQLFNEEIQENIRRINSEPKLKRAELLIRIEKTVGDELIKISIDQKIPYRTILGVALLIAEGQCFR